MKANEVKLRLSKRDAKTYFDVLRLPVDMCPFFGRPRANLGQLAEYMEVILEDLRFYLDG